MKQAEWIWENLLNNKDEYVKFYTEFYATGNVKIDISCDSNYTFYVNGKMAGFGAMADYPNYKVQDTIDISSFINNDKNNKLVIVAWYYGENSQVYFKGDAGLIFEIYNESEIFAFSSNKTLCKIAEDFTNYRCKKITNQLGFSFCYNAKYYDYFDTCEFFPQNYHSSLVNNKICKDFHPRGIKRMELLPLRKAKLIDKSLQLYDLGEECVGFLNIKFKADFNEKIVIAYGEHIVDGGVRHKIGTRDFTVEIIANGQMFEYLNTFRRLGMRYFQIISKQDLDLEYIGLRETLYPLSKVDVKFSNDLDKKIYEASIKTLQLCMHEHYEDCPWREQALYTMDSRNQMLCGYYAFKEFKFARASLNLMSKGMRPDGMMPICFPCGDDCPLPSFALIYIIQMYEYAIYSGDMTLLQNNIKLLEQIVAKFTNKIEKNGLLPNFSEYWNFYEWSEGLDCAKNGYPILDNNIKDYDLPLNCDTILALQYLDKIYVMLGIKSNNEKLISTLQKAVYNNFYVKEKGIFKTYLVKPLHFAVLSNSLAVLSGCAQGFEEDICENIVNNDGLMIDITASMKIYEYDALIKTSLKYKDFVVKELRKNYGYMLEHGATTFWETIKGDADFGNAGSLCHGWNAIAVYYFNKLDVICK